MFPLTVDAADDDCEDSYVAPRKLLISLVAESFPQFDESLAKHLAENILFASICCLEPHEMDESWARSKVERFLKDYRGQVLAGKDPKFERSITRTASIALISHREKWAREEYDSARRVIEEYPEQKNIPQKWDNYEGRTPQEQLDLAKKILKEEKEKREMEVKEAMQRNS
jgi:hypothetical protein